MSTAATLLADLEAIGLAFSREGQALRVRIPTGVDPAPYRELITTNKPSLLKALLHREENAIAALTDELERGWRWMETHRTHAEHDAFLARWVGKLHEYMEAYRATEWRLPPEGTFSPASACPRQGPREDEVKEARLADPLAPPPQTVTGGTPPATPVAAVERSEPAVGVIVPSGEAKDLSPPSTATRLDETPDVYTPDDSAPIGCPTPGRCPKLGGCAVYRRSGRCGYDRLGQRHDPRHDPPSLAYAEAVVPDH